MADGVGKLGAIERVEVELANPAGIKLAAQFAGDRRGDQLARRGQIVEPFEQAVHPVGDGGAAHGRRTCASGRRSTPAGCPGTISISTPARRDAVAEAEEIVGREEELADRAVGAGVDLGDEIVEVAVGTIAVGMDFGIGRDRNFERRDLLQPGDQLGGIGIALRMGRVGLARLGRIAAQRDDVTHAGVPIGARDIVDLAAARADAGQVRGGRKVGFAHQPLDRGVGPLAGRSAGAIGHRHEARRSGASVSIECHSVSAILSRLGREEFEADLDVAARRGEQRRVAARARVKLSRFMPPSAGAGVRPTCAPATATRSVRRRPDARLRSTSSPAASNQRAHRRVREAEPRMGVALAQFLALVRGEIDDQQAPAGASSRAASAIAWAGACA